jgi:chromatin segregation and condensation protein Rec8/ScpA/Scc1 (kleisin family)
VLARALARLLDARPPAEPAELPVPPRVSLAERIAEVRAAVEQRGHVAFSWLAAESPRRSDLIVTFLAVLELYRSRVIRLQQDELFGEIWLAPLEGGATPAQDGDAGRSGLAPPLHGRPQSAQDHGS